VLLVTGSFALIYVLGTAAAVRLLPRGSWAYVGAIISLIAVTALFALTGVHVVWGLAVAAAGVIYDAAVRRRSVVPKIVSPSCTVPGRAAP
jgi:amino acid efflux transporter